MNALTTSLLGSKNIPCLTFLPFDPFASRVAPGGGRWRSGEQFVEASLEFGIQVVTVHSRGAHPDIYGEELQCLWGSRQSEFEVCFM